MPGDFIFTEKMLRETSLQEKNKKVKKEQITPHPSLEEMDDFTLLAWNVWFLLVPFLKKKLRKRCSNGKLRESNGDAFFSLIYTNNILELHTLQPWAAKKLDLPEIYVFKSNALTEIRPEFQSRRLIEAYAEIVCKLK